MKNNLHISVEINCCRQCKRYNLKVKQCSSYRTMVNYRRTENVYSFLKGCVPLEIRKRIECEKGAF